MIKINGITQNVTRRKRYYNRFEYKRHPPEGKSYGSVEGIYIGKLTCFFIIYFRPGEETIGTIETRRGEYNYSVNIDYEPTKRALQLLCAKLVKHVSNLPYCDN